MMMADAVPVLTAAWMSSTGVHGSVDNWRLGGAEKLAVCAVCRWQQAAAGDIHTELIASQKVHTKDRLLDPRPQKPPGMSLFWWR